MCGSAACCRRVRRSERSLDLIDTHCHLNDPPLADAVTDVLARARSTGLSRIVVPAYDLASWVPVRALAARFADMLYPALGLHPWAADQALDLADLEAGLRACGAVAVGEIGLDSKIDGPSLRVQVPVLERQLVLARELDLPVILHCRGAFGELAEILQRFDPPLRGVLHAFSRSADLADRFVRLGLHLGIGGAVTRPQAARVRSAVVAAPLERLVLETDAPAIGLHGVEAANTEPRHVREVAAAIAELRGCSLEAVAAATTCNAAALFGW
jgi:TatD DNase family protein